MSLITRFDEMSETEFNRFEDRAIEWYQDERLEIHGPANLDIIIEGYMDHLKDCETWGELNEPRED